MARAKKLNICVRLGDTGWVISRCDNGQFELYNTITKQIMAKSNNPMEFDKYTDKIFGKGAAKIVRDIQTEQNKT
jgi:hypothetical protein